MKATKEQKELKKMPKAVVTFYDTGEGLKVEANNSMATDRLRALVNLTMKTLDEMLEKANENREQAHAEANQQQLDLVGADGQKV